MADEINPAQAQVEKVVDNADIPAWQTSLAAAVNETYSYANNNLFYAVIPAYYRDYAWRYIRVACQWLDGYVPAIHQSGYSGIMSTRIATKLITGLTKQVVGEKLVFKLNDTNVEDAHDTLHFVSKWSDEQNIIKAVFAAIGFALGVGTSVIKINKTDDGKLWWEAVRFDNCFYLASFKNEVKDATFVIRNYTDTREGKSNQQFFLVEHRFWKHYQPEVRKNADGSYDVIHKKGDKEAMVEYKVHRVNGTNNQNLMPSSIPNSSIKWQEIPKDIRDMIKHDYGTLKIDEPQKLGLPNLGVEPLLNGEIDISVPTGTNFGESMIVGIQDDLITYELATSYLVRDMYLGKGTVYMPKSLNLSDVAQGLGAGGGASEILGGIGDSRYEYLKGMSPEEQQVIVQQFNLRGLEWQQIKEASLKNIAVKWSMSPKILASFLANTGQVTATQIDSEDDMSIAFIYHTRAYFKAALNRLLETTLNYYGYETNVTLDFASPSLINKDRLLDRVIKELQEGLIDLEEAIRTLNPDLEEEAIKVKIDKALQAKQEQMLAALQEMNDVGGSFGPDNGYENLGGENLNGSTAPEQ